MALFSAKFFQNAHKLLHIPDSQNLQTNLQSDIAFKSNGYLLLADESQAEQMIENHKLQLELGASVELLNAERIQSLYPHINTSDVLLGSRGTQNEGWFNPWALLRAMSIKTQSLGGQFISGEVVDFKFLSTSSSHHHNYYGSPSSSVKRCNSAIIRNPITNQLTEVEFGIGVICTGIDSIQIASKLGYNVGGFRNNDHITNNDDMRIATEFPIEPR